MHRLILPLTCCVILLPAFHSRGQNVTVHLAGTPVEGQIQSADDTGFEFKLSETGEAVRLRWSDLQPRERYRIQRMARRHGAYDLIEISVSGVPMKGRPVSDEGSRFQFLLEATGDVVPLNWSDVSDADRERLRRHFGPDGPAEGPINIEVHYDSVTLKGELVQANDMEFQLYLPDSQEVVHILWSELPSSEREAIREKAALLEEQEVERETQDMALLVAGNVIHGQVEDFNEDGFKFRLALTGDVVGMSWRDLGPGERTRIQRLVGLQEEDEPQIAADASDIHRGVRGDYRGERLEGVKLWLKGAPAPLVGLELPEESSADSIAIKNRVARSVHIPRKMISKREPVRVFERDVYDREELYERYCRRHVIDDAGDEYEAAKFCRKIGYPAKALEHLERACVLHEGYEEQTAEMRAAMAAQVNLERGEALYYQIQRMISGERYFEALPLIEEFEAQFGNHPLASKLEEQANAVSRLGAEQRKRRVVSAWYRAMRELARRTAFEQIVDGPSVAGRVVTTKGNRHYIGVLQSIGDDYVILQEWDAEHNKLGQTRMQIARSQVVRIMPTELNHRRRWRSRQEMISYVKSSEFVSDVNKMVAAQFKITEEEVEEMWAGRLDRTLIVDSKGQRMTPLYVQYHWADYGTGTWMRSGGGSPRGAAGGRGGRNRQRFDADEWWAKQPRDLQMNILLAMAAEAHCDVVREVGRACTRCGGEGGVRVIYTEGSGGSRVCSFCMGQRYFVRLLYR